MAREQGVYDLRDHGVFVAVDARKKPLTLFDGAQKIAANFIFDGARSAVRIEVGDTLELTDGARLRMHRRMRWGMEGGHLYSGPILRATRLRIRFVRTKLDAGSV